MEELVGSQEGGVVQWVDKTKEEDRDVPSAAINGVMIN
jgi:hypothetical protein